MKRNFFLTHRLVLVLALSGGLLISNQFNAQQEERVSRFGIYRGYSQPIYDGWVRTSQYITVRDGTKLAVDILRPTKNGQVASEPLPVLWTHSRYHRTSIVEGTLRTIVDWGGKVWDLPTVIKHGYVVVAVDTRGGGASYGTQQGFFSRKEAQDAYDITEWLAVQPWSNGAIGMYGRSYLGITQYFAASEAPPHLKVIFPEMAFFDVYSFVYPGGVYRDDFISNWNRLTKSLDALTDFEWLTLKKRGRVAPVDEDLNGEMLAAAIRDHEANRDMVELFSPLIFRNSIDEISQKMIHLERSPWSYMEGIKKSGVAIYHYCGWLDMFPRDALLWFKNLDNPQKLVMGPWFHSEYLGFDLLAERLRWYDYWLKGIDTGIMDEAPIHYWTMGAPKGEEWRSAWKWPLPNEELTNFYFQEGPSDSIQSINDGLLDTDTPRAAIGQDDYVVDYTTTTGKSNRWANGYGGEKGYPDMASNDAKGLTYTTAPLVSDVEVTGHPVVHLWVSSTAEDGDFFIYLEEVDQDGRSNYITEGTLRASHRAITKPPFDYLDLPYHRSYSEDISPLPAEPTELVFDLHPTSNIFDTGNRIRVTITCADKDNTLTLLLSPPPRVSVYRNSRYHSYITLPVIPAPSGGKKISILLIVAIGLILVVISIISYIGFRKKQAKGH